MPAQRAELYFPFSVPLEGLGLPAEFGCLRQEEPVAEVTLATGDKAWLVTRYADVRAVLEDPRFSPSPQVPARVRELASTAFTERRVERLHPGIHEIADDLLTRLLAAGPPAELITGFTSPLSSSVIFELLGVPREDCDLVRGWTEALVSPGRDDLAQARCELDSYLAALIAHKRRRPDGHLFSSPGAAREDLLSLGTHLITVGHESTAASLTSAILVLLCHPGGITFLNSCPAAIPAAVEELLRFDPLARSGSHMRVATEDTEIAGVPIGKGEAVLAATAAANHDPAEFAYPHHVILTREPNPHLAFGSGAQQCPGAPLARAELQIALGFLVRRLPRLELGVPWKELTWETRPEARRLRRLPVMW
ncbi:cytochrome P450 [Nonomuraea endophytica]|uniref:cytochrome P450 n=1 Tax=Nonomuraea endophytica TaxID=714136 RepID=UPI0037CBCA1E